MKTKRIILEIEESLHQRIKDFAIKDKRTMTVVLRMMTEEMLEKLINDKEKLNNNILTNDELHDMYGRTLTTFELNKIKKDPNYKPVKDVIILNDNEYKEYISNNDKPFSEMTDEEREIRISREF